MWAASSGMNNNGCFTYCIYQIQNKNKKLTNIKTNLIVSLSIGSTDAILSIVNVGASVSSVDKDGLTALHCAASRGHHECIEALIGLCGAEGDVLDNNGSSPLFYAVTLGHSECTTLLISKFNSNPNIQDAKGRRYCQIGIYIKRHMIF